MKRKKEIEDIYICKTALCNLSSSKKGIFWKRAFFWTWRAPFNLLRHSSWANGSQVPLNYLVKQPKLGFFTWLNQHWKSRKIKLTVYLVCDWYWWYLYYLEGVTAGSKWDEGYDGCRQIKLPIIMLPRPGQYLLILCEREKYRQFWNEMEQYKTGWSN